MSIEYFDSTLFSPEYQAVQARFQDLFQRIAQSAVAREQQRQLPFELVDELRSLGFARLRVPQALGGFGLSLPQLFHLLAALATADSNLTQIFRAHFGFVEGRLNSQDGDARDYWLGKVAADEVFLGAAMAERTEVTQNSVILSQQDDQWYLNGTKYYSTGTLYANWISAAASNGDEFVSVLVPADAPGVSREDDWDGFGQRLSGSGTTRFEQVAVASQNIIRRFKRGEFKEDSYIGAFYQMFHLATLAGISRAILNDSISFVQQRTRTFGVPGQSSPKDDPLVQRVVGRLASLNFTAESLVAVAANKLEQVYQRAQQGTADEALYAAADITVYQAQQILVGLVPEAASLLFEVGGASATSEQRRLDRHWRNARTLASHNPAILRERAIGDFYLNGVTPGAAWHARFKAAEQQADGAAPVRDEASAV